MNWDLEELVFRGEISRLKTLKWNEIKIAKPTKELPLINAIGSYIWIIKYLAFRLKKKKRRYKFNFAF